MQAMRHDLLAVQNVQLLPTKAQPSVYADWLRADGAPTVLVYGHYGERPMLDLCK